MQRTPLEALLWLGGLIYLAVAVDPYATGHLILCLWSWMGFEYCPGCGLGQSIAFLFQGELVQSIQAHPLGIPTLLILIARIAKLLFPWAGLKGWLANHKLPHPTNWSARCRMLWS